MRWKLTKGYVLVAVAGLYFAALAIFVLNNIGNPVKTLSVYWKVIEGQSVSLIVLISMAAGIIAWFLLKAMIVGIKSIRLGQREERLDQFNSQAKAQKKAPKHDTPAEEPIEPNTL